MIILLKYKGILFLISIILIIICFCGCISDSEKSITNENTVGSLFSYTITGIDPGSGIMKNTETTLDEYDLKQAGWKLHSGTSTSMTDALLENVTNKKPIIITIWSPHAVFGVTDLRKLEDPKMIYNNPNKTRIFLNEYAPHWKDINVSSDIIASVVSANFSELAPAANEFLKQFNISDITQSRWIYLYTIENNKPEDIAKNWIYNNSKIVNTWKPDNTMNMGKKDLVLGQPDWPGVTVKNQVVSIILQEIGYNISIKQENAGEVYNDLISGNVDIMLAGWLPTTHGDYWEGNTNSLRIAGINVYETWLGLAIPDYMDETIREISDLLN